MSTAMHLPAFAVEILSWGLLGIGLLSLIEKLIPIIPSYVLFVFLGMAAVAGPGELAAAIAVSTLGSVIAGLAWFTLGRALGEQRAELAVRRYGRYVLLSPGLFERMKRSYQRNAVVVTLVGHAIPVVRFYLPLPAGVLSIRWLDFVLASAAGCLVWNAALLSIGYAVRHSGLPPVQVGIWVVLGLLALEASGVGLLRWYHARRRRAVASA